MEPHDEPGTGHERPGPASEPESNHRSEPLSARSQHIPDAVAEQPSGPAATPARPTTGNQSVAAALHELSTVGQRPLAEHPDAYARVHAGLQQALSDIDDA